MTSCCKEAMSAECAHEHEGLGRHHRKLLASGVQQRAERGLLDAGRRSDGR
jgi:hypothetical protein